MSRRRAGCAAQLGKTASLSSAAQPARLLDIMPPT
jgi:hypothetical protein